MAASQFTIYTSQDTNAPILNGQTGSLLIVLNACLVSGYGSKPGAGWLKQPLPDTGSYGCFQQATGSKLYMFLNDAGQGTGSLNNPEARITGWESITSILGGWATGSNSFPTLGVTTNTIPIRKSNAITSASIQWTLLADSSSMYFFAKTGDTANTYQTFFFGDIYSFVTGSDPWKCTVIGRNIESSSISIYDRLDYSQYSNAANGASFIARSYTGAVGSIAIGLHSFATLTGLTGTTVGIMQYPNGSDNGLYICPRYVHEPIANCIRGKMRGYWQILHPIANFVDGQVINGTGTYAGKQFQVFKLGGGATLICMEISNTVDTN